MDRNRPILLVEDDEIDAAGTSRALRMAGAGNALISAKNGREALKLLYSGVYTLPGLILSDLNMPVMGGMELLKVVKNDVRFRCIPFVFFTTSEDEKELREAYRSGVSGYLVKPADFAETVLLMQTLFDYWSACRSVRMVEKYCEEYHE